MKYVVWKCCSACLVTQGIFVVNYCMLVGLQMAPSDIKSMEDEAPEVTDVGPAMFSTEVLSCLVYNNCSWNA